MRGVSPDALGEVATSLKLLVRRAEKALRTVDKAGESWPVDSLAIAWRCGHLTAEDHR